MRILPVNNYNYQIQNQKNNQKQNVNFGMIQGEHIPKTLCDLAGFKKLWTTLTRVLTTLVIKEGQANLGGVRINRAFSKAELAELKPYIAMAKRTNVVISPQEEEALGENLAATDIISNEELIRIIKAEVSRAKLATFPIALKLEKLSESLRMVESLKQGGFSYKQRLADAERIKLELYKISVGE